MKIMKKSLAVLLALLTLLSVASFGASADETGYNYSISTEFYSLDSNGEWVPAESVASGDSVKMRVSVSSNFVSGSASILLAYDKSVLTVGSLFDSGSVRLALNDDFALTKSIQQVSAYNGQNAATKQLGLGNITSEQYSAYSFITLSIYTSGCLAYDGSDWLFEIDMSVLKGSRGKELECFVIPETVCTVNNTQGYVSFPYAPSTDSTASELTSAFLWYDNAPVLESEKVTVVASPTERTAVWVVDGVEEKVEYYEIGDEITGAWTPEKTGYTFAGWTPEIPDAMPDGDLTFTAQWSASTDTRYSVETYTMNANGEYLLSTQAYTGTTDETVSATPEIAEGFELNGEKSVLSGAVAADGSLVLKVYIDRKTYTFTTVVDGVPTSADYRYGAAVPAPAVPSKQGWSFTGWDNQIPSTMPAENVTLTAKFSILTTVAIKNNPGSKSINYGETLRLTAITANLPEGAYVKWYVEGSGVSMSQSADGLTCEVKSTSSGTATVTAKVVDRNGNAIKNDSGSEISDSQKVVSNAGFWQKIVSFFKNLFGSNRTIVQLFRI